MHLASMGIRVGDVDFDVEGIRHHADQLVTTMRTNLSNSLESVGVDLLRGHGYFVDNHTITYELPDDKGGTITAKDIIICTGSVPAVPPGIQIDGKTVFSSDDALKMSWLPPWVAIIGSGYIGLEFADIYTALGSEVTFIEAVDKLMPAFDGDIARMANRLLIQPRHIDAHSGVFVTKVIPGIPNKVPVKLELTDAKTGEAVDTLEVDACLVATGRSPYTDGLNLDALNVGLAKGGAISVNDKMQVLAKDGSIVEGVWCIGDANARMMLAHAASAQGISAVENMTGNENVLNHLSVPAACFTHPEISFCGLTEEQARAEAEANGFSIAVSKTSYKANSKAQAENEADGMAKLIYRSDTGEILGVHIMGLHAADLIHEASNAIAANQTVADLKFNVHAHPTTSEVIDELIRNAKFTAPELAADDSSAHADAMAKKTFTH
eukprot:gene508-902_t